MVLAPASPIIHGPIKSKRFGQTLVIDLGSQELALAVSRSNRMPRASVVVTTAAREIIRLSKGGEKVESVVFIGSAVDPTNHPSFLEITENVRDLRNKWFPKAKLTIISDNPELEEYRVRHALGIFDRPILRMEWGSSKLYTAMTGNKGPQLTQMVKYVGQLEKVIISATFQRGTKDNSTDTELRGFIKRVLEIKPVEVQITNLLEKVTGQKAVTPTRFKAIQEEIGEKTGLPVVVWEDLDPLLG